jgi:predicted DCC family thiol-disulfide oxidoreductase YuxK
MDKPVLIYDGECPVCQRARDWVAAHMEGEAIAFLPCQETEQREAIAPDVSYETCMAAMQLVMPDGQVFAGEQAFPALFRRTRRYKWLAGVMELPVIRNISPHVYHWIATHRHEISGFIPKKAGETCSIDKGCE